MWSELRVVRAVCIYTRDKDLREEVERELVNSFVTTWMNANSVFEEIAK